MRRLLFVLVLAACNRPLPGPVALATLDQVTEAPERTFTVVSRHDALTMLLATDPLARRPRWPSQAQLDALDDGLVLADTLRGLSRIEGQGGDMVVALQRLAASAPGTERLALVRGHMLGLADTMVATYGDDMASAGLVDVGPLLSGLTPTEASALHTRHALAFLADGMPFAKAVRQHGDRWVLEAWLDGPHVPLQATAQALGTPTFDALSGSALGRLVHARAEGRKGDAAPGLADLRRATTLALQQVAADRDSEQRAWRDRQQEVATELDSRDPIGALLDRAATTLTAAAHQDLAAGGALLAIQARRLVGGCDWRPCMGLDRVETLTSAARWDPSLEPLAQAWKVIALKRAIDGMDVGRDTVVFRIALIDLVDALLGTGAHPLPATVTARVRGDASLWATLGASLGDPSPQTWEDLHRILGAHLAQETRLVGSLGTSDADAILDQIQRRALP